MASVSVVIPNWNGKDTLGACLDSLLKQTYKAHIIVVENGSVDGSLELLQSHYPDIEVIINRKNLGFAGGVNCGIRRAIDRKDEFVALFNNDAIADKNWLKNLITKLETMPDYGIATCKFLNIDGSHLDSTGEQYTTWGLAYARGRGEKTLNTYDEETFITAATGGASLYRTALFEKIGLFDADFFAYYEDVDLSLRAQLAGWKVIYVPTALVYHEIGGTSRKIKDFTTYQTIKNLPMVVWKDLPTSILIRVLPRFLLAYALICGKAITRKQFKALFRGLFDTTRLLPRKLLERYHIQHNRTVGANYIWSILVHDLPPDANNLRTLRRYARKLLFK